MKKGKKVERHFVKARMASVEHDNKKMAVPMSESYRFFACDCDPPCGNVNFVFEDIEGVPFGCAQLSYEHILGPLTEAALEAREAVGEKTN